jgi:hypothetical protein
MAILERVYQKMFFLASQSGKVKGAAISRTMSKISSGVWEKSGGVREKCADTIHFYSFHFLFIRYFNLL